MGATKGTGDVGVTGGQVTLTLSAQDAQALLTALTHAVHGSVGTKDKGPLKKK
jgi:hypothetical protein